MSDDNVRPITQSHQCASCGHTVMHDERFDPALHGESCRQPEIRMRRLEARVQTQAKMIEELRNRLFGVKSE
jgi:hypothetical protein